MSSFSTISRAEIVSFLQEIEIPQPEIEAAIGDAQSITMHKANQILYHFCRIEPVMKKSTYVQERPEGKGIPTYGARIEEKMHWYETDENISPGDARDLAADYATGQSGK